MVADEAEAALGVETPRVVGDDAGRFLAAMLEGVKAERGDRRRVGKIEDAEDAAIFAQTVAIEIVRCLDRVGNGLVVERRLGHSIVSQTESVRHICA
ncbi:hypothetical protein [Methylocystis parvus]|uniref:hypothetical protein n=1 Tax=Methylocystis parvus TaxID=134 RepID=UPI003C76D3DF